MTREVYFYSLKDYFWMIAGDFICPLIVYSIYFRVSICF